MSTRLLLLLAMMGAFFDLNALTQRPLLLQTQDTGFDENPAPGVTVTTLAIHILDEVDRGGLRFDRVPLGPGRSTADVLASEENLSSGGPSPAPFGGPQLLYVEAGVVVVDGNDGETVYPAGEQFVMPAGAQYNIRNDTGRCASVLRLVVEPLYGGGFGSLVGGPELSVQECGAPRNLLTTTSAAVAINVPSQAFIARVTLKPGDFDPGGTPGLGSHTHPGRTVLVVEEGTMMMQEGSGGVDGITYFLEPGSVVEIGPGEPHAEYYPHFGMGEPAVVTIAGVVPVGQELITPHDQVTSPGLSDESTYTNPLFDFTIAWDDTWSIAAEAVDRQVLSSMLELTNGTSVVFVEGIQAYDGDPQRCTTDLTDQLASDPNVSNLRMLDPDSQLDARSDTTARSVVQYSYTFSYSDGTTEEMVKHMECRTLTPGSSVLMINAFIPLGSFQTQSTVIYELLDGLVIGE